MVEFSEDEQKRLREIISNLAGLNGRALMSYWITSEIEEAEVYNELAKRVLYYGWDPRIPRLFEELAKDNLNHAEALLREYKRTYGNAPLERPNIPGIGLEMSREKLEDNLRNGRLADLVKTLMEGEKLARDVYEYLAEKSSDDSREVFKRLANIENDHYLRLKSLLDSLER